MTETNLGIWILWILGAIIVLVLLLWVIVSAVSFAGSFSKELAYIKEEIHRTEGSEQRYWKKRKRKLWLSLLPFRKY